MLKSSACHEAQLVSPKFQEWLRRLKQHPGLLHRKEWEFAYICEALEERGVLAPGKRGLGFAVGTEPLSAYFATRGCEVVASDLGADAAEQAGWVSTNQHAAGLAALNTADICPPREFARRVSFRVVDMNHLPADLAGFDFCWSSCSIEHLGSILRGHRFMTRMVDCLKPGGVAVHTTEFNCDSDRDTVFTGGSVVFRRRDLLALKRHLEILGHQVETFDFATGDTEADRYVDPWPYQREPHLKLRIDRFASTSIGIIVRSGGPPSALRRLRGGLFLRGLRARRRLECGRDLLGRVTEPTAPTAEERDPFWVAPAEQLRAWRAKPKSVAAPPQFANVLPGVVPVGTLTGGVPARIGWVVLHKGDVPGVPPAALADVLGHLRPAFANEVFVVYARKPVAEPVGLDQHLGFFLEQAKKGAA